MGLGNGGLGRLAACFLDSLSTLDFPALGYGIHYEFGLFKQEFVQGHQVERPDRWILSAIRGNRPGRIHPEGPALRTGGERGRRARESRPNWVDTRTVLGVPHDIPIAGYGTGTVNLLRLWASRATEELRFGRVQLRRLCRGRAGEGRGRDDLQGAVPQ